MEKIEHLVRTSLGPQDVFLPADAPPGASVCVMDLEGQAARHPITVAVPKGTLIQDPATREYIEGPVLITRNGAAFTWRLAPDPPRPSKWILTAKAG